MNQNISPSFWSIRGRITRESFILKYFLPTFILQLIIGFAMTLIIILTVFPDFAEAYDLMEEATDIEKQAIAQELAFSFGKAALFILPLLVLSFLVYVVYFIGQIKRLHDMGVTGILVIFNFIPIGYLVMLIITAFFGGTAGPNQYGEDPNPNRRPPYPPPQT